MMKRWYWPLVLVALFALAGCATTTTPREGADAAGQDMAQDDMAQGDEQLLSEEGMADEGDATVQAVECPPICDFQRGDVADPASVLAENTIYFEFDSSVVRQQYMDIVKHHSAYLTQFPNIRVRVEGHTDERGTREYNIGLGRRRAQAVADLLKIYGVDPDQITTISYGEEMPAVVGHGEWAWSQNRRVELVYPRIDPAAM